MARAELSVASLSGTAEGILQRGPTFSSSCGFIHISQGLGPSPGSLKRESALPAPFEFCRQRMIGLVAPVFSHRDIPIEGVGPPILREGYRTSWRLVDIAPIDEVCCLRPN